MAKKREAAATMVQQMLRRIEPAAEIVAADGNAGLSFQDRSPAHEMRALGDQLLQARAVFHIVAVAQKDDTVGLLAVLVGDMPVARQLLEGNEQVVAALRAGSRDGAEHGEKKRIDQRIVGCRIFEEQESDGIRMLCA